MRPDVSRVAVTAKRGFEAASSLEAPTPLTVHVCSLVQRVRPAATQAEKLKPPPKKKFPKKTRGPGAAAAACRVLSEFRTRTCKAKTIVWSSRSGLLARQAYGLPHVLQPRARKVEIKEAASSGRL